MRGCGNRKADSIYLESRLSLFGQEIENLIIDPPIPTEKYDLDWSRSYQPFEKDGIVHLIDWVGESYYPSVWDFIEECRRKGASRKVTKSFDFSQLTLGKSNIFFAHKHAINPNKMGRCEVCQHRGAKYVLYTNHITPKNFYKPHDIKTTDNHLLCGVRNVGDIEYAVEGYDDLLMTEKSLEELKPGLFLQLPITNMVYVKPANKAMLEKIKDKKLPIEIVNE